MYGSALKELRRAFGEEDCPEGGEAGLHKAQATAEFFGDGTFAQAVTQGWQGDDHGGLGRGGPARIEAEVVSHIHSGCGISRMSQH